MKMIVSPLLCCAVMALSATAAERTQSRVMRIADPASCQDNMEQDSMETVPATDDPAPVLMKAADAVCKVPQAPISA